MNPLAYFIILNYFFHPRARARAHVNSHGHGHVNDYECIRDRDRDHDRDCDHYSLFKGSGSQASFSKHFLTRMH